MSTATRRAYKGRFESKCHAKSKYTTVEDATFKAQQYEARGEGMMSVYLCTYCFYWHVGHNRFESRE